MKRASRSQAGMYFLLPNAIFLLGLSPGELAVYAYLMCCEDRKTYQCWPSYKTIGKAVGITPNTVRTYVIQLVERDLIRAEQTKVFTKKGMKRNGTLMYTILPIQDVLEAYYQRQLEQLDVLVAKRRMEKKYPQAYCPDTGDFNYSRIKT